MAINVSYRVYTVSLILSFCLTSPAFAGFNISCLPSASSGKYPKIIVKMTEPRIIKGGSTVEVSGNECLLEREAVVGPDNIEQNLQVFNRWCVYKMEYRFFGDNEYFPITTVDREFFDGVVDRIPLDNQRGLTCGWEGCRVK